MKIRYKVIGAMSGTSLDGLDLACCQFEKEGSQWKFELVEAVTVPYPKEIGRQLVDATSLSALDLLTLDIRLAQFYSKAIEEFIRDKKFSPDFVASHGHTIFHQPENRITYQAGNGQLIANVLRIPVVSDFRRADVLAGGQGAPLVPIGDQLLFSEYEGCLNLGGIANISFDLNRVRIAYDICATNIVLNYLSQQLSLEFDPGGKHASEGTIVQEWLGELNELRFYRLKPPKSLGFEWVDENILQKLHRVPGSIADKLRTYVEHIAMQISSQLTRDIPKGKILVTGGGTHNEFLIGRISQHIHNELQLVLPSNSIINYKEALIFAFLGALKWAGEVNILSSVTGVSKSHSAGTISIPMT